MRFKRINKQRRQIGLYLVVSLLVFQLFGLFTGASQPVYAATLSSVKEGGFCSNDNGQFYWRLKDVKPEVCTGFGSAMFGMVFAFKLSAKPDSGVYLSKVSGGDTGKDRVAVNPKTGTQLKKFDDTTYFTPAFVYTTNSSGGCSETVKPFQFELTDGKGTSKKINAQTITIDMCKQSESVREKGLITTSVSYVKADGTGGTGKGSINGSFFYERTADMYAPFSDAIKTGFPFSKAGGPVITGITVTNKGTGEVYSTTSDFQTVSINKTASPKEGAYYSDGGTVTLTNKFDPGDYSVVVSANDIAAVQYQAGQLGQATPTPLQSDYDYTMTGECTVTADDLPPCYFSGNATTAEKVIIDRTPPTKQPTDEENVRLQKDCEGGELGWLTCAALKAVRDATVTVSGLLDGMLKTNTLGSQVQSTWASFRNVANVLFAIAFMIVIFSQATSIGIGAYGIKRLLPRIIAAVILVNISFFFCQLAIDISNVTGNSITGFINGTTDAGNTVKLGEPVVKSIGNLVLSGTATILTGVGIVIAILFFLTPILILMLVTFFVIALRTALIILLTVVAPIAFVAWILPNTEKWFKKWLETFVMLLALYPLVMITFAIATSASSIVVTSGEGEPGGTPLSLVLIALIIQALPLFALPALFKLSGSLLGRVGSLTQRMTSPVTDKSGDLARKVRGSLGNQAKLVAGSGMRKTGAGVLGATNWGLRKAGSSRQFESGSLQRKKIAFQGLFRAANMAAEGKKAQKEHDIQNFAVNRINSDGRAGQALRERGGQQFADAARAEQQKQFAEGVANIRSRIDERSIKDLRAIFENAAASGDHQTATAAMESLGSKGGAGVSELADALRNTTISDSAMQETVMRGIYSPKINPQLGSAAIDVGKNSGYDSSGNLALASVANESDEKIAGLNDASINLAADSGQIDRRRARRIRANKELWAKLSEDAKTKLNSI